MRRLILFLARPEQGKTACPPGKQFYFKTLVIVLLLELLCDFLYWKFYNREAIDSFWPTGAGRTIALAAAGRAAKMLV